ncbi:hypothetical protein [Bacillus sp. AK128]
MTQLLLAVEKLKQYYVSKLQSEGVFQSSEKNPYSYTLKELEEMFKKTKKR